MKTGTEVRECIISFEMFFSTGENTNLEGEFPKGEVEVSLSDEEFTYLDTFINREKIAIMQKLEKYNTELFDLIAPPLNKAAEKIMQSFNCLSNDFIIKGITIK